MLLSMTCPNLSCSSRKPILSSRSRPLPIEPCEQAMARFLSMPSEMFLSFLKASLPQQLRQASSHEVCALPPSDSL